jgi:adenylosuccinate lyase
MDQISEHQRDLTNSASQRFVADYLAGFAAAVARMREVLRELGVDRERMARTLSETGDSALAEPMYILLSLSGEPEAHEIVRTLTLECEREGIRLLEAARRRKDVWARLDASMKRVGLPPAEEFFADPTRYRGIASRKARAIAEKYRAEMVALMEELGR